MASCRGFKSLLIILKTFSTSHIPSEVSQKTLIPYFCICCLKTGGTLGTGQRFTPKKRTVPVICFESGIDHIAYQLYGLTDEEIRIVEGKN